MRVIYEDRRAAALAASRCAPIIDADEENAHTARVQLHRRAAAKLHQPAIIEVW